MARDLELLLDVGKLFPLIHQCLRIMCLISWPSDSYDPNTSTIIQGSYLSAEDFLQSSLSKTDIWRTILAWAMSKRWEIEQRKRDHNNKLTIFKQKNASELDRINWYAFERATFDFGRTRLDRSYKLIRQKRALEQETQALEQESQALEMILHWFRCGGGQEALKRAEYVLDGRRVKPTDIEKHIELLLALVEQEYCSTSPRAHGLSPQSLGFRQIFNAMREEIPKLIGMHQRLGTRNPTLEARFSATLDKILRLSSWTPSSTHNKHLRELLRNSSTTLVAVENIMIIYATS